MKVIKFAPGLIPVLKHGEHDQKTHGNWATGTDELSITRDKSSFEQKLILQNKKGEMLAYVEFQEHLNSVDILFIRSYDSGKGYATKLIEELYSSIPKEIYWGKTSAPQSTHLAQKFSDKYGRTKFMPWAEGVIAGYEWGELYGDTTVKKHQEHDQSTHGNWAISGQKGGSGFTHRMMFQLKRGRTDTMARQVYEAEEKHHSQIQDKSTPAPTAPNRADFEEYDDYNNAHKKYSRDFLAWSKKVTTSVISPIAEKHLDGTPRGVEGYVRDVLRQDWFIEAFGTGGEARPQIKVSSTGEAGSYQIGFKGGSPYSVLTINRGYSKNEPTMVHEIAHYATTISATTNHDGHGVEFARNHIFIAGKVMGESFADGLEKSYREAGVPLGD